MENLDKLEKAGRIAGEALQFGKGLIKENTSLLEITKKVEDKITELGGKCAFPVQLSLNEVAAHYNALIEDKIIIKANDVVKLDVGVHVDGFIGDNALTVSLNEDYNDLVKASEKALEEALKIVRIGTKLREIGGVIESEITNLGYKPVKNLTGHSIEEYREHAGLAVPNFDNGDNWELKENDVIAIEPFATDGVGFIEEKSKSEIMRAVEDRNVRNPMSRKVLGYILENYNVLPFAKRWLLKDFKQFEVNFSINDLMREKIVEEYKQLVEKSKAVVSQAEHTIVVLDKPIVITKI